MSGPAYLETLGCLNELALNAARCQLAVSILHPTPLKSGQKRSRPPTKGPLHEVPEVEVALAGTGLVLRQFVAQPQRQFVASHHPGPNGARTQRRQILRRPLLGLARLLLRLGRQASRLRLRHGRQASCLRLRLCPRRRLSRQASRLCRRRQIGSGSGSGGDGSIRSCSSCSRCSSTTADDPTTHHHHTHRHMRRSTGGVRLGGLARLRLRRRGSRLLLLHSCKCSSQIGSGSGSGGGSGSAGGSGNGSGRRSTGGSGSRSTGGSGSGSGGGSGSASTTTTRPSSLLCPPDPFLQLARLTLQLPHLTLQPLDLGSGPLQSTLRRTQLLSRSQVVGEAPPTIQRAVRSSRSIWLCP